MFVLVPVIGVFAWLAVKYADAKREMIELQRFEVVNALTSSVDLEVARVLGILSGIAGSDDLLQGSYKEFHQHAAVLATQSHILRIWAFTKAGDVVASAGAATERSAPPIDNIEMSRVFDGGTVVSTVRGEGIENATVVLAMPVSQKARVVFGVAAEVSVAHLSEMFEKVGMGPDWAGAIVDRNGRYVARSLDAQRRVGQVARPELGAAALGLSSEGIFENVTYEGVPMLNAFSRSELTGWTSVVAVPKSVLAMPHRQAIALVSIGGIAAISLAIGLALVMAERISEPVRNLSNVATALVEGRPFREPRYHIAELDEVRKSIERAIEWGAHHSALVASSGDAIMSMDLDGKIRTWNPGAERLFGYAADEIIGQPKALLVPEDRIKEFQEQRARLSAGSSIQAETARRTRDGRLVDVSLDAAPIRRPDGRVIAISSILHDITERKAAEIHLLFLMRELSHRSKNQLAIIQSIASQTGRNVGSVAEFLARFRQRLQSLSTSHDLLVEENWTSVPLAVLVKQQLQIFAGADNGNVKASGPDIRVNANAAGAIGLALHELATNSVKYGALSGPAGKVDVAWRLDVSGAEGPVLELTWRESGGPPVTAPASTGFGSLVIERMAPQAMNGNAQVEYLPEGLQWRLTCPAKDNVRLPRSASGEGSDDPTTGGRPPPKYGGPARGGESAAMS